MPPSVESLPLSVPTVPSGPMVVFWGSVGIWVVLAGVFVGVVCAVDGLRTSLRAMERMGSQKEEEPAPVSFNDHE